MKRLIKSFKERNHSAIKYSEWLTLRIQDIAHLHGMSTILDGSSTPSFSYAIDSTGCAIKISFEGPGPKMITFELYPTYHRVFVKHSGDEDLIFECPESIEGAIELLHKIQGIETCQICSIQKY